MVFSKLCSRPTFVGIGRPVGIAAPPRAIGPALNRNPPFSAAKTISSSTTVRALLKTTHSTISSFPSPSVFHTAFSSSVTPVMETRVPPPDSGEFFWIRPNSTRLGGIRCPAYLHQSQSLRYAGRTKRIDLSRRTADGGGQLILYDLGILAAFLDCARLPDFRLGWYSLALIVGMIEKNINSRERSRNLVKSTTIGNGTISSLSVSVNRNQSVIYLLP